MKCIIMLDPNTPFGAIYASGSHDGVVKTAKGLLPFLDAEQAEMSHHYFLFARRPMEAGHFQSLRIPYHAIAGIVEYAQDEPRPFGFIPTALNERSVEPDDA
jgi:hypothetical protein